MSIEWRALKRFLQYSAIGAGTFAFDLLLLFLFTDILGVYYLISVAVAFLLAVSLNYHLSRRFVFKGSKRSQVGGYVYFIAIALVGMVLVTGAMYVMVELLGIYYLLARVVVACVTGVWNYLLNLFFNFKVAGQYE